MARCNAAKKGRPAASLLNNHQLKLVGLNYGLEVLIRVA